jgi:hypothetical protein
MSDTSSLGGTFSLGTSSSPDSSLTLDPPPATFGTTSDLGGGDIGGDGGGD